MKSRNKEYADLLRKCAKKLEIMEDDISIKTIVDIENLSKSIINEGKIIRLPENIKTNVTIEKFEITEEYKKIVEEADRRLLEERRRKSEAAVHARNFIAHSSDEIIDEKEIKDLLEDYQKSIDNIEK